MTYSDARTEARQAQLTKTDSQDYTPPQKWGSGTIKPIAEFLSYRSWPDGSEAFLLGDMNGAVQGSIGGTPSAAGGEACKHLAKGSLLRDVRGKHHRPTFINLIDKVGKYSACRSPWLRQGSTSTTRPTSPGLRATRMWTPRQNRER
ncbi:hypothetical protein ACFV98_26890 [Streptomyces violascens]|uniref:hypothetical protein n=1 Tax=Streptomyces violascens TaxID=67381 RepID=UPI00365BCC69